MSNAPAGRPPCRADHIGSLLRPKRLREAFRKHAAREMSDVQFRAAQDEAMLTQDLQVRDAVFTFHDADGHESKFTAPYVTGKVSRGEPITIEEFGFVSKLTKAQAKITMPAPSTMHFYRFTDWGKAYKDAPTFFADLGKVYQAEIAELAKAGCRYVQLDEVAVAMLCDPAAREKVEAAGEDPDRLVDLYIDAINQAVKNAPPQVTIGVHVCRGNYKGMYLSEGGYDSVAEKFFGRTRVNHFLLEFDTLRAGGFDPLRFVPKDKGVVLGLVSSKTPQLEQIDVLKRRTEEAAKHVDLSRLAISPQCGFASTMGGNPVTEADERAKLELCVRAAQTLWS